MKIKFLGTSYGAPSLGRHQQSMLVETDAQNAYLIDAGAPITDILVGQGYDFSRIRAVFITHLHGDHMNGLHDLINLAEFLNARFTVYLSEQRGIDAFENYTRMQLGGRPSERISFELFCEGDFYDDGDLSVGAVQNDHMKKSGLPSYGFMLKADGKRLYVTGDLHPSLCDFPAILYGTHTDLIVTECAHFEPDALVGVLNDCNTEGVAFVHVMPPEKYDTLRLLEPRMKFAALYPCDNDERII